MGGMDVKEKVKSEVHPSMEMKGAFGINHVGDHRTMRDTI